MQNKTKQTKEPKKSNQPTITKENNDMVNM